MLPRLAFGVVDNCDLVTMTKDDAGYAVPDDRMKMPGFLLTSHKADWVCLHVGRRPVILCLRRDGSVPVAGVVVDHVLFVERLLPVQDV